MLSVVSGNACGHHLFKGCLHFRILFDLPFDRSMHSYVGQRVHRVALKLDFVGGHFAQVCEFKRVVNVAQVHVFLHGLAEESVVPGKRIYCSRLDCFIGELMEFSDQLAKFQTFVVVHFLHPIPPSNKELKPRSRNFGTAKCGRFFFGFART